MYLVVLSFVLLIVLDGVRCACVLRTFVGTNKGCKWLACNPQSDAGACAFSSSNLLDALDRSFGLNLTALEGDLQKCFDASRVLLSMLVINSTSRMVRDQAPRQPLAPLLLATTRELAAFESSDVSTRDLGEGLASEDLNGAHADRAVLQASANTDAAAYSPSLPQALAQVSQCPTAVPQGVSDVAAAEELLHFVALRCRDVAGVPATYVFGDIVGAGQVTDVTVCLPSEIQRNPFVAAEACLAQSSQDQCLEEILEMWNMDVSTARAVASAARGANSTCVWGDAAGGGDSAAPPSTSRTTCLVARSAAAEELVSGLAASRAATLRSGAAALRSRWVAAGALLAGFALVGGTVGMG